jgi:hypothetical protein
MRKTWSQRWALLIYVLGWLAAVILVGVGGIAGWIIFNHGDFTDSTVGIATGALLADLLGASIAIWRSLVAQGPVVLAPVTEADGTTS